MTANRLKRIENIPLLLWRGETPALARRLKGSRPAFLVLGSQGTGSPVSSAPGPAHRPHSRISRRSTRLPRDSGAADVLGTAGKWRMQRRHPFAAFERSTPR